MTQITLAVKLVGAITPGDRVARLSGNQVFKRPTDFVKPNLVAPGIEIPLAKPGGGLQIRSVTSMAAAHVAGVAALLFQAKPQASALDVEDAILTTCTPLPESSEERCGRGLINPLGALDALLSNGQGKVG
jgi:subtilisin family serine protease